MNVAFDHDHDTSQSKSDTIPAIAKRLKARNQPWALIVDENYGEGSAREHAALQPRFYGTSLSFTQVELGFMQDSAGCAVIVARSFARIHETNLKVVLGVDDVWHATDNDNCLQKQGVLPLWFVDKADYARIGSGDVVETFGLEDLMNGNEDAIIKLRITNSRGETFEIPTRHTMSSDQVKWLKAGSALNFIRSQMMQMNY